MESVIRLENVYKTYKLGKVDVRVLKGINLEINKGDFTAIKGPSGSGKSTLLNMLGCLDTPTEGKIFWEGKDVSTFSEDRLAEIRGRNIGFIFQRFNLLHNLTALENVTLPMVFQGISEGERVRRAEEMLGSVGLEKRMTHRPNEMSGGEQQRIAIARALANNPEVILADEPTGNLDSSTGKVIMEILIKLHKEQGRTVIVITHDPRIAEYTEDIVGIEDGEIVKNHLEEKALWGK